MKDKDEFFIWTREDLFQKTAFQEAETKASGQHGTLRNYKLLGMPNVQATNQKVMRHTARKVSKVTWRRACLDTETLFSNNMKACKYGLTQ